MKKLLVLAFALLLFVSMLAPAVFASSVQSATVGTPSLTAIETDGSDFMTRNITQGQNLSFSITFKPVTAVSGFYIKSITLITSSDLSIFPFDLSGTTTVNAGIYAFNMTCSTGAAGKSYALPFSVTFLANGAEMNQTVNVSIQVTGNSTTPPQQEGETSVVGSPKMTITGYKTNPDPVVAGEEIELTVTIKNNGTLAASNMKVTYSSDGTFTNVSGASSFYVSGVSGGSTVSYKLKLKVKADVSPGSYPITFNFNYDVDGFSETVADSETVAIPVIQVPKIQVDNIQVTPDQPKVGSQMNVSATVNNIGKSRVYNVNVLVKDNSGLIDPQTHYIGNIEPGSSGTMDVYLDVATVGQMTLSIVFTYESEDGTPYELTKTATASAVEPEVIEPNPDTENEEGSSLLPFIIIGLVVLVGAGVAIILIMQKKKREKEEKRSKIRHIHEAERKYLSEHSGLELEGELLEEESLDEEYLDEEYLDEEYSDEEYLDESLHDSQIEEEYTEEHEILQQTVPLTISQTQTIQKQGSVTNIIDLYRRQ